LASSFFEVLAHHLVHIEEAAIALRDQKIAACMAQVTVVASHLSSTSGQS
jgi:hypothetical protein